MWDFPVFILSYFQPSMQSKASNLSQPTQANQLTLIWLQLTTKSNHSNDDDDDDDGESLPHQFETN